MSADARPGPLPHLILKRGPMHLTFKIGSTGWLGAMLWLPPGRRSARADGQMIAYAAPAPLERCRFDHPADSSLGSIWINGAAFDIRPAEFARVRRWIVDAGVREVPAPELPSPTLETST